jgi:ribosomal subunit interface protein
MQLTVTGKQIDVGEALRQHVAAALNAIVEKYFSRALEAHVTVSREAHLLRADISVHVHRDLVVQGHGQAGDAYSAFDQAADRIAKRIRRHKRRLRDHHGRPRDGEGTSEPLSARSFILRGHDDEDEAAEAAAGDQPVIVAEMTCDIPQLSVGEAVMRMDLADLPSFIFRNRAHGGLNVVYRRSDGNIGWVDPDFGSSPSASGRQKP